MKYIMCSPSNTRFLWEDKIAVSNLLDLGVVPEDIILLYENNKYPESINCIEQMKKLNIKVYDFEPRTNNLAKAYIPSVRPYLWWKFLSKYPEYEQEDFVYQDSDIIYRKLVTKEDFPNLNAKHWYGADVESYVGYDYLKSKEISSKDVFEPFKDCLGVTDQDIKNVKGKVIGAHWIISKPTASYWHDVYVSCYTLYQRLKAVQQEYLAYYKANGESDKYYIQVWCSEMYSQMYLLGKYGITTEKSSKLDFNWSSDLMKDFSQDKYILHNAGVTDDLVAENPGMFNKGIQAYKSNSPWDILTIKPLSTNTGYAIDEYTKYMLQTAKRLGELK